METEALRPGSLSPDQAIYAHVEDPHRPNIFQSLS
jgi:hypothetical protein